MVYYLRVASPSNSNRDKRDTRTRVSPLVSAYNYTWYNYTLHNTHYLYYTARNKVVPPPSRTKETLHKFEEDFILRKYNNPNENETSVSNSNHVYSLSQYISREIANLRINDDLNLFKLYLIYISSSYISFVR